MILAGIDEAGYGPLLGPLVVGCCAFDVAPSAGETDADLCADLQRLPCLWKRLGKLVSRKRVASGKKLHVNDSKLVYAPASGLAELERSVLAVASTWAADPIDGLDAMIARVAPDAAADLAAHPWYAPPAGERFPLEQDPLNVKLIANGLRAEMRRASAGCVHLAARVVPERRLNAMFAATRNKSSVLFSTAAIHLDNLIRTYGDRGLVVFCDRQGGRAHYGSLLRLMFDEWALEVVEEVEGSSSYALRRGDATVRILFREKAEAQCLPVAMASMLSKYLREALMRRFNAYWKARVPSLTPTAGYYNDGLRFLQDIDGERKRMNIDDEMLVRSR